MVYLFAATSGDEYRAGAERHGGFAETNNAIVTWERYFVAYVNVMRGTRSVW